jgi:hypothetical protein
VSTHQGTTPPTALDLSALSTPDLVRFCERALAAISRSLRSLEEVQQRRR